MFELSNQLGISKKTLYEIVRSKEDLILEIIEASRKSIKEQQAMIYDDQSLSNIQKLRSLLTVVPVFHMAFNYNRLEELKKRYPAIYERVVFLFESDWDRTFGIMQTAIDSKEMKTINLSLFKKIYINAVTALHDDFTFEKLNLTYKQALEEIISILLEGIIL